jgi:hypothetical protein
MGGLASPPISPVKDLSFWGLHSQPKEATKNLGVKTMANCETCKGKEAHAPESVPYIVHELSMARMERHIKRLWISLVICIAMLFACNASWLIYESQFETIAYEQDGDGINNVSLCEQGDLNNGAESEDQTQKEE